MVPMVLSIEGSYLGDLRCSSMALDFVPYLRDKWKQRRMPLERGMGRSYDKLKERIEKWVRGCASDGC